MPSKVQICNFALSRLASDRIESLTDQTKAAKECNARYDIIADIVMAQGAWPSTIRRATLAQSSTTPEYEYAYQYQLPTNPKCLTVLEINEGQPGDIDHKFEGGYLLTNEATASIKYIARVTDTENYDVYLMQGIIEWLAAELAYTFTGQATIAQSMMEKVQKEILPDLLNRACVAGSSRDLPSDTFTAIRR